MKKFFFTLIFVFTFVTAVYADEIRVTVDGTPVDFANAPPVLVDGRTLVPVRAVFEALNFDVDWNPETQTATLLRGADILEISIGAGDFVINGQNRPLDVPAQIIDGRTMLPIRLPLESVGYGVAWDGVSSTVLVTSGGVQTDGHSATASAAVSPTLTPAQIFANNVDAVFILHTYDAAMRPTGGGSGFFINPYGVAVTCHHVMVNASYAFAITEDGREFEVVGFYSYDIYNDLAVIQVDGQGETFTYLVPGDSDAVRVGDSVFAIGSPFGEQNTFAISYVSRIVPWLDFGIYSVEDMIQITAPIYPGSSGGALLNDAGLVIGVTAAIDPTRAGVAFVIPIARVDSGTGEYTPLPVTPPSPTRGLGEILFYAQFPSIPDFLSVSPNATFIIGGTADDLGFVLSDAYSFDYVFIYELSFRHFVADTERFDALLEYHGFELQIIWGDYYSTVVYLHNPTHDLSVTYVYLWDLEELHIALGRGNALLEILMDEMASEPDWPSDSRLIGSWQSGDATQIINYYADGTGSVETLNRAGNLISTEMFIWHSVNGELEYIMGPFSGTFWEYRVVGQSVTFTSETGVSFTYTRVRD
ncbi:MAG: stalk domain-containing protein [Defluviitaleaceae bacterium]|nr:stalk domain-containing protein [Defluviitaleaceae bacterium]